jgi:hypothetical protein
MVPVNDNCVRRDIADLEGSRLGAEGAGPLTVNAGVVWLTLGDGTADIVLSPVQSVHFEPNAMTIASALGGPADVVTCEDAMQPTVRAA